MIEQSQKTKVLNSDLNKKSSIKTKPGVNSKVNGKVNARLRYFTSQINNIPGPKDTGLNTMAEDLGKERRDNMVF